MKSVGPKQAQLRALRERSLADARRAPKAVRIQQATELARRVEQDAAPSEKAKKGRARVGRADGVVKEIEGTLAEVMAEIASPSEGKERPKPKQKRKSGKKAAKSAPDPDKPKFDKKEYQRKLMRDRRAKAKAAKGTSKE